MTNDMSLIKSALGTLHIRANGGRGFENHGYPLTIDEARALLLRFEALEVELRKYDPSFQGIMPHGPSQSAVEPAPSLATPKG